MLCLQNEQCSLLEEPRPRTDGRWVATRVQHRFKKYVKVCLTTFLMILLFKFFFRKTTNCFLIFAVNLFQMAFVTFTSVETKPYNQTNRQITDSQ